MNDLNLAELFLSAFLPLSTVSAALFGLLQLKGGRLPEGRGALAASMVLGLGAVASGLELDAWLEGGWWMALVAVAGAYAVGSAVASRLARSPGPRRAALAALAVTLALGGAVRWYEVDEARQVVERAAPEDRAFILEAASHEAWRPVQLAGVLAALTATLLLRRRTPPAALAANAADVTGARASVDQRVRFSLAAR